METAELTRFEAELRRKIQGDVLFDDISRLIYATDASLYEIEPLAIVLPRTHQDLIQAVRTAAKYSVTILPRGGGTSLAGQTVSPGLVMDCSKYLNRVLELNQSERWVRVQPGIVLDNLNDFLKTYNLQFAPDVSTSSRANIGGMIGNNSAGVRSIRYGKTVDHVLELSVILSTGEEFLLKGFQGDDLERKCSQADREGEIYSGVRQIVSRNREEIIHRYPKVMRRVGGYNLDELLGKDFNLAKLIVGSEGTLAFVTEAKLNLEPLPRADMVSVLHCHDLIQAIDAVPVILRHRPSAVEILDPYGLELARSNPAVASLFARFVQGTPQAILLVEFSGDTESEITDQLAAMKASLEEKKTVYAYYDAWETQAKGTVWAVRKNALGILLGMKGDEKPLPFIEDACVPTEHLSEYIARVLKLCQDKGRRVAMYAHASAGVIHVRPILSLKRQEDVDILRSISAETFKLVREYGGSWSGEHGDGLVRSYKNQEFFGDQLYQAFSDIKGIFDPPGLMNPGKIVATQEIAENLRIHPGYRADIPTTFYRFEEDQGFDRAVEMCTGVGHCRKTLSGTMCPSYMATLQEKHSTRGRANALRMAMTGRLGTKGLTSPELYEVLDLCLECKACKSECPSNVDMARIKSEFLAHYYQEHGLPLGKKLFSRIRQTAEWASHIPNIANVLMSNYLSRWLLEKVAGLDRRRQAPVLATQTLTRWFAENRAALAGGTGPEVALFVDTFVNFYEPAVGTAAVHLLKELDYQVVLADMGCCGRPLISAGQLGAVKSQGDRLIQNLREFADRKTPIIVLEPSCLSTLSDDYLDLMDDRDSCRNVVQSISSLEDFLTAEKVWPRLVERMGAGPRQLLFHGHCQHKALFGTSKSLQALSSLRETKVEAVDSGCCGMAGSFGYEKAHYRLSEQAGERRLFPAVRSAGSDSEIVASGFSCRSQIEHFTGRRAKHMAEVLAQYLCSDNSQQK